MKIEAITLREIRMPLVHFFETSFGRTYNRRILLVTAHCEGVEGWGECVAGEDPFYSSEWIESAWATIASYLAPVVVGQEIESGREGAVLMGKVRGHRMAKAAVENALWDAEARHKRQPLWKLLGGTRSEIPCGVSIGIQDSVEQLLEKIQTELDAGYRRIKVKIKPGWDVNVLERIRARWAEITLSCDANSAYTLDQVEHLRSLDQFNLLMIEQPLWDDDIYYHARLQKELRTSICLDESIVNPARQRSRWKAGLAASLTSRWAGWEGLPRRRKSTMFASEAIFPSGAGGCWNRELDAPTTSRFLRSKISAFRETFRPPSATGKKTSSILRSRFPRKG